MAVRFAGTMGLVGTTWQARGYAGEGGQDQLGTLSGKTVLVCGSARTVFADLAAAQAGTEDPVILAVNDVGMFLPRLDHWVTLHSDNLGAWKAVRWCQAAKSERTVYHTPDPRPYSDVAWTALRPLFCLSGYFGMQLAWIMGAARIILCGCPGDATPRFFEGTLRELKGDGDVFGYGNGQKGSDEDIRHQLEAEMARLPEFKGAVRSMSGWTRDFFGAPDFESHAGGHHHVPG